MWNDRWPKVRAALLAGVIAVHGLAAAPLPHVVTPNDLKNPVSADEVAQWASRLSALGWPTTPDALGQQVVAVTGVIGGAHRAALAPVRPALRLTGTGQAWGLFANPDNFPERLTVRVRDPSGWRIVYRRVDPERRWDARVLEYRRVRGIADSGGYRTKPSAMYERFAQWVGRRALAAMPEVSEVEVSMVRTHTTLPGAPRDPAERPRHVVTVKRSP
ncbi:MAG: hypothetical protein ABMA64_29255 [Myxococcota bacterium]